MNMRNEDFIGVLRQIKLPRGVVLGDGTSYRLNKQDFPCTGHNELEMFEKFLILSDGCFNVVGGILFYGSYDIQVTTFPEYRDKGYMSAVHKNGILKSELYPNQEVSIETSVLRTLSDFQKRQYMLKMIGLVPKNISEIYKAK